MFVWTGLIFAVSKLFKGSADYINLARGMGFAGAPLALGIIPSIGGLLGFAYTLLIQIRLVREVSNIEDGPAIATVLIPFALVFIPAILVAVAVGIALLGVGAEAS